MAEGVADQQTFEIFKLCLEFADRTTARRAGANTFFVSLHSIIASVVAYVAAVRLPKGNLDHFSLVIIAAVGVTLSLTWWGILRYFRRLNRAKWEVINNIEKAMPIQPFTQEWQILHPEEASGKRLGWFRRNRHREATVVEQVVPLAFAIVYVLLGIRVIAS
jgi:hypothetical protein